MSLTQDHAFKLRPRGRERILSNQARELPPIEKVTRHRLDIDYMGFGKKLRFISISLPRVKGYFEEEPVQRG